MYDEFKKQLTKYIAPSPFIYFMELVFAVIILFIAVCVIPAQEIEYSVIFIVIAILCGVGGSFHFFGTRKKIDRRISEIDRRNGIQQLIDDFNMGGKAFKDQLILGQCYCFGKGTGTFLRYDEIKRIYQSIHSTNGIEDNRTIKIETVDGKTVNLCQLKLRGKSDDELQQVFAFMASKNSKMIIGFY